MPIKNCVYIQGGVKNKKNPLKKKSSFHKINMQLFGLVTLTALSLFKQTYSWSFSETWVNGGNGTDSFSIKNLKGGSPLEYCEDVVNTTKMYEKCFLMMVLANSTGIPDTFVKPGDPISTFQWAFYNLGVKDDAGAPLCPKPCTQPVCDSFYENPVTPIFCKPQLEWAMTEGIYSDSHDVWYPGLTDKSPAILFQNDLFKLVKCNNTCGGRTTCKNCPDKCYDVQITEQKPEYQKCKNVIQKRNVLVPPLTQDTIHNVSQVDVQWALYESRPEIGCPKPCTQPMSCGILGNNGKNVRFCVQSPSIPVGKKFEWTFDIEGGLKSCNNCSLSMSFGKNDKVDKALKCKCLKGLGNNWSNQTVLTSNISNNYHHFTLNDTNGSVPFIVIDINSTHIIPSQAVTIPWPLLALAAPLTTLFMLF